MPKPASPPNRYDCATCPGYCCSYDRIVVTERDVARLAQHLELSTEETARKFTRLYESEDDGLERILKHHKDEIYGSVCRFFDRNLRRCTVYAARPAVCRQYPNGTACGYYTFLKFERKHQGDDEFIPSA
jgi:uncharacterized protein